MVSADGHISQQAPTHEPITSESSRYPLVAVTTLCGVFDIFKYPGDAEDSAVNEDILATLEEEWDA